MSVRSNKPMIKMILRLLIVGVMTVIILKTTTFGWRFSGPEAIDFSRNGTLAKELQSHVYELSQNIGNRDIYYPDKLDSAARYIVEQFKKYGYEVSFQEFIVAGRTVKNIIAQKTGSQRPAEIIIVGAHYDTCLSRGADDNASGVAGLLELAALLRDKPTQRSIKFIAFVNEEAPFFQTENMGSLVYARAAKAEGQDIKAMVALEMLGYYSDKLCSQRYPYILGCFYPNRANYIAAVGNFKSAWLVKKIASGFKSATKFPLSTLTLDFVQATAFSDHWAFWKEGYPAVMVTDTAFYRYPHYHQNSDTYEKLDYPKMAEVVKGLCSAIVTLAE